MNRTDQPAPGRSESKQNADLHHWMRTKADEFLAAALADSDPLRANIHVLTCHLMCLSMELQEKFNQRPQATEETASAVVPIAELQLELARQIERLLRFAGATTEPD